MEIRVPVATGAPEQVLFLSEDLTAYGWMGRYNNQLEKEFSFYISMALDTASTWTKIC
jgi:hypothetical protein